MPFSLRSATLKDVVEDMSDLADAYLDDLIVFSNSWSDHLSHLRLLLSRLKELGLTAKPTKYCWGAACFTYLGHVVGRGLVSAPDCK